MSLIEDVSPEELAKLFHHYQEALAGTGRVANTTRNRGKRNGVAKLLNRTVRGRGLPDMGLTGMGWSESKSRISDSGLQLPPARAGSNPHLGRLLWQVR
jgi:hypothetical protein